MHRAYSSAMRSLPAILIWTLLAACHDAPEAPPCRTSEPRVADHANAGCVITQDGRMLVLKHRFGGKLGIPGGAATEGEIAQCAAHRETWEETGLNVTVGRRLGAMRYGFVLFQCHPDGRMDADSALELPWHARTEITSAIWLRPGEISRDQWRYEDQVDLFMELVEPALERGAQ